MDLEERTIEDNFDRRCAICEAELRESEILASREAGGPFLCSVHAEEQLPAVVEDEESDDVAEGSGEPA